MPHNKVCKMLSTRYVFDDRFSTEMPADGEMENNAMPLFRCDA
jgi:hypothetical protein